jgi:hypothetical protein
MMMASSPAVQVLPACARLLHVFVPNLVSFREIQKIYNRGDNIQVVHGEMKSKSQQDVTCCSMMLLHGNGAGESYSSVPQNISFIKQNILDYVSTYCDGNLVVGNTVTFDTHLASGVNYVTFAPIHRDMSHPLWNTGNMYSSCLAALQEAPEDVTNIYAEIPVKIENLINPVQAFRELQFAFYQTL